MTALILSSIPKKANIVRIHVGGDFFNQNYFNAWLSVAHARNDVIFYAYTKSLKFWIERLHEIPFNFKMNASRGGTYDYLIQLYGLKSAEVVFSEKEATDKGLEIDHDDTHAYLMDKPFALLLHGAQPKGSVASKSISALRAKGIFGYQKGKGRVMEGAA